MSAAILRQPVRPPAGITPAVLATVGSRLLVLDSDAVVHDLRRSDTEATEEAGRFSPGWSPDRLALAPSGRHALLEGSGGMRIEVWDVERGRLTMALGDGQLPASATFVRAEGRELIASSARRFELELLEPGSGAVVTAVTVRPSPAFDFDHLATGGGGTHLLVVGHYFSEGMDSLLSLSVPAFLADAEYAREAARSKRPFSDYAWRLAAGPCGLDQVVAFRDPEDDEVPDEGEEPSEELQNFRGFYVRDLVTGKLLERISSSAAVPSGADLVASERMIAAAVPDGIVLVPRHQRGDERHVPAAAAAFDPVSPRVAIVTPRLGIELITLV